MSCFEFLGCSHVWIVQYPIFNNPKLSLISLYTLHIIKRGGVGFACFLRNSLVILLVQYVVLHFSVWDFYFFRIFDGPTQLFPLLLKMYEHLAWDCTVPSNVNSLISLWKPRKTPKSDRFMPKILKVNVSLWTTLLAALFIQ